MVIHIDIYEYLFILNSCTSRTMNSPELLPHRLINRYIYSNSVKHKLSIQQQTRKVWINPTMELDGLEIFLSSQRKSGKNKKNRRGLQLMENEPRRKNEDGTHERKPTISTVRSRSDPTRASPLDSIFRFWSRPAVWTRIRERSGLSGRIGSLHLLLGVVVVEQSDLGGFLVSDLVDRVRVEGKTDGVFIQLKRSFESIQYSSA